MATKNYLFGILVKKTATGSAGDHWTVSGAQDHQYGAIYFTTDSNKYDAMNSLFYRVNPSIVHIPLVTVNYSQFMKDGLKNIYTTRNDAIQAAQASASASGSSRATFQIDNEAVDSFADLLVAFAKQDPTSNVGSKLDNPNVTAATFAIVLEEDNFNFNTWSEYRADSRSYKFVLGYLMRNVFQFRYCDTCYRWLAPATMDSESNYSHGKRTCNDCEIASRPAGVVGTKFIAGYHENADGENYTDDQFTLITNGDETPDELNDTIGIELEITGGSSKNLRNSDGSFNIFREFKPFENYFLYEEDGSLAGDGFEFVSQPFTYKYMKTHPDFLKALCIEAQKLGAVDSNMTTGLHIHFNKKYFGETALEQGDTIAKVAMFIGTYKSDFIRLSGRDADCMRYCRICDASVLNSPTDSILTSLKRVMDSNGDPFGAGGVTNTAWSMYTNSHGYGINCRGTGSLNPTIEFRFFKSTSDYDTLMNDIELMHGLIARMRLNATPWGSIYSLKRVLGKADVSDSPRRFFMNKCGAFRSTVATAKKGEDFDDSALKELARQRHREERERQNADGASNASTTASSASCSTASSSN